MHIYVCLCLCMCMVFIAKLFHIMHFLWPTDENSNELHCIYIEHWHCLIASVTMCVGHFATFLPLLSTRVQCNRDKFDSLAQSRTNKSSNCAFHIFAARDEKKESRKLIAIRCIFGHFVFDRMLIVYGCIVCCSCCCFVCALLYNQCVISWTKRPNKIELAHKWIGRAFFSHRHLCFFSMRNRFMIIMLFLRCSIVTVVCVCTWYG